MDHTAIRERPAEEVSVPPPRSGRFTGLAVLAAVAAAVLGISVLGDAGVTRTGFPDLAAHAAQGTAPADPAGASAPGAGTPGAGTPAGGPGAGARPASPAPGSDAAAGHGQQAPTEHTVGMAGLMFLPQALTVAVGDTVTWINDDSAAHTVTVVDGPEVFESELLNPGDSFSYTFTLAGEYRYYCAVHPDMKATVLVEGPAAVPPAGGDAPAQPPAGGDVDCVPSTAFDAFVRHVEVAHLQSSPGQQTADLLALDQYIKTHTVLVQDMLQPTFDGAVTDATAKSLDAFWKHLQVAHLQSSPSQQLADILATDRYVKTHTVLVQDMLAPHIEYLAC